MHESTEENVWIVIILTSHDDSQKIQIIVDIGYSLFAYL